MNQEGFGDLDDQDLRLLHRLADDVPPDFGRLADDVGGTPEEARERYGRLRRAGVITECAARLDPARVGVPTTGFLLIRTASAGGESGVRHRAVVERILADLEVAEAVYALTPAGMDPGDAAGGELNTPQWLVTVRVTSVEELHELAATGLPMLPGLLSVQVFGVARTVREAGNADRVRLVGR